MGVANTEWWSVLGLSLSSHSIASRNHDKSSFLGSAVVVVEGERSNSSNNRTGGTTEAYSPALSEIGNLEED